MDIIQMARDLGTAIQQDERYIKLSLAQQKNDEDTQLQGLIGQFNLKRIALNQEMQKSDRSQEKLRELDAEIKDLYKKIFSNSNMLAYNEARSEMDEAAKFINQIIMGSVNGEDPQTIEPSQDCGGDCSGCSGCH